MCEENFVGPCEHFVSAASPCVVVAAAVVDDDAVAVCPCAGAVVLAVSAAVAAFAPCR